MLKYRLTPRQAIKLNSFNVSLNLPISAVAGRAFRADNIRGKVPREFGDIHLHSGELRRFSLTTAAGELSLQFPQATTVLLQDNRKWGPSAVVRIGPSFTPAATWDAGKTLAIQFTLSTRKGITVQQDRPVTITAGDDWIPLNLELDIESGSALDFSQFGQIDAPAGKHGWLQTTRRGEFVFAKDPEKKPRRFYGINLCFSAHYITHEQAEILAERLLRLGYNTVRFHHHEGELVDRSKGSSTTIKAGKLDQLDYLFAALKKRGLYVTTDLFVSRPVFQTEIWDDAPKGRNVSMNDFKMLIPVNEKAYANWQAFARNFLTHVNPYTKLRYADDPALPWLSLINEGNFGNYLGRMNPRVKKDWQRVWNTWLRKRYETTDKLKDVWKFDVKGDVADSTVALATNIYDNSPRARDLAAFLGDVETRMVTRMTKFLRDEIRTKALITNSNGWTNRLGTHTARRSFDYVDDHFYVDHPQFLEKSWRLPSRCPNTSPVAAGAPGGRHCAFRRVMNKPFTLSEYNYSGPGRFRGVGGILTGAMASLQDWSVVWRFAYSHSRGNLFKPSRANYFDMAGDPLNQAAERASLCLFLRGDMKPAPHRILIGMDADVINRRPLRNVNVEPSWHALALVTRVGTLFQDLGDRDAFLHLPTAETPDAIDPYKKGAGAEIMKALKQEKWMVDNRTDLSKNIIESETGELLVDAPRDVMVLNTAMTAGGYAPQGEIIKTDAATIKIAETDATVWVSSVDGKPIQDSGRMIVTHLTDLQNTNVKFAEQARQTLLDWGKTPHLVLNGTATITIKNANAENLKVWALATSGKRVEPVNAKVNGDSITVPLSVKGKDGARLVYEVAAE